jgi:endonuclease/exonuclease/phosphatase (EEP) superfamily protein YafD
MKKTVSFVALFTDKIRLSFASVRWSSDALPDGYGRKNYRLVWLLFSTVLFLLSMKPSFAQDKLRVMCWNINIGAGGIDKIAAEINRHAPDIVLLNEVKHFNVGCERNQTDELSQRINNLVHYKFAHTVATGWTGHKVVSILSKYPLGAAKVHRVIYQGKETAFAAIQSSVYLNGEWHQIFSTRFAPHNSDEHILENKAALKQFTTLMQNMGKHTPVIFGGDFNADETFPEMKDFIANSGLINVANRRPDPQACGGRYTVDYIFYRGAWEVSNHQRRCPDLSVSDHAWVIADFVNIKTASCFQKIAELSRLDHMRELLVDMLKLYDPKDDLDKIELESVRERIKALDKRISTALGQRNLECRYPEPQYKEPIGYLDAISPTGLVNGWALDPDLPAQSIPVHLYIDGLYGAGGTYLGSVLANQPRPDVSQTYPGNHGFNFQLPQKYMDGITHKIYAYGIDITNNDNSVLTQSPKSFNIRQNRRFTVNIASNAKTVDTETITVTAKDSLTGAVINASIVADKGGVRGQTGVPLTFTNAIKKQICDEDRKPPCRTEYHSITTTFTVSVPGYDSYVFTRKGVGTPYEGLTGVGSNVRIANDAQSAEKEPSFADQVRVYPNPDHSRFITVELPSFDGKATVFLKTLEGKIVYQSPLTGTKSQIITSHLANGMYILVIDAAGQVATKKLLIQH